MYLYLLYARVYVCLSGGLIKVGCKVGVVLVLRRRSSIIVGVGGSN